MFKMLQYAIGTKQNIALKTIKFYLLIFLTITYIYSIYIVKNVISFFLSYFIKFKFFYLSITYMTFLQLFSTFLTTTMSTIKCIYLIFFSVFYCANLTL